MVIEFSAVKPVELKCEYKINAAGIDNKIPRFSWLTPFNGYNSFQIAFRILVASSLNNLLNKYGDIWDSGKVSSSDSVLIKYSGNPLNSNKSYFWQVSIWNKDDQSSSWSDPEEFSTGLFALEDWEAKWISHPYNKKQNHSISFQEGIDKWIWHPLMNKSGKYKSVILSKSFEIKDIQMIESAEIIITADEKFILYLNDFLISESDDKIFSWSRPVISDVKRYLKEGTNKVRVKGLNSYVEAPGIMLRLEIKYTSGELQIINSDLGWKSCLEYEETYADAIVIKSAGEMPYRIPEPGLTFNPPAYLRKSFSTDKKIERAVVYCSALGLYSLQINGKQISSGKLLPGWSDFNKRVYYNTYNVTSVLSGSEKHFINVILADGYYSGYCGWEKGREYYEKYPALKLQLMILYGDGTEEIICSDLSWISSEGPIREGDILMGEYFEAEYPLNNLRQVRVKSDLNPVLTSNKADEVKPREEIRANTIRKLNDSTAYIIDFGQNFAGFVRLHLNNVGKRKIVLRFAEGLNKDGSPYIENLRMARAQDTYISKGDKTEIWEPLFTYHGFRYVEISGLDTVDRNTLTGISINSLPEQTGYFNSSNLKLNKLFDCILWNQKSNYVDIPTDCPQRDERFGWTGDAVSYFRTAAYNFDISGFYNKWFENLYDAQREDGQLPPFAPLPEMGVGPIYFNSAGWADAGIIALYQYYEFFNDIDILAKYYNRMKLFISSLIIQSKNFLMPDYGYGDWLFSGEETSKSFIATSYFAYDIYLMNKIASILERSDDAVLYKDLHMQVKGSFRKEFLNENGTLKQLTQTSSVLAIYFHLLDPDEKEIAKSYLVQDIINKKYHITLGFLGLSFLMPVLNTLGRDDIAWKVLTNNEFPSWFYMINQGATTLWERWDSYHHEKGFFDPTMNSFNHCSLGCIGEWLFSGIAGIKLIEPGFKKVKISSYIPEDLNFAEASFKSKYGIIKSRWEKKEGQIRMNIEIPFNTSAEVVIPSGIYHLNSDHHVLRKENNYTNIEVGSGSYEITYNSKY